MMIRPAELRAIKAGEIDVAFRRWDRPRVLVGTKLRTGVGLIEVTSVERVAASRITATDARRAGAASLADLRKALSQREDRDVYRVGLAYAGPDPRTALRESVPDAAQIDALLAWLDRLDRASAIGPWTRATLELIDHNPAVRAPDLAAGLGRPTAEFKRDVRKLKEKGLTESLDIGYRLSPRGAAVLDHGGPSRKRERAAGTPLPRVGHLANRALTESGIGTLEQVASLSDEELLAMRGVGPIALQRLREALAESWPEPAT